MNRLVLCMIVKNEGKVVGNLLDSVKGLIDYWVIVDTGSTDDTIPVVEKAMASVPGEAVQRPWVNFGHNRTEALNLARDKGDYIICLDADMVLVDRGFDKNALTKDAYYVLQRHSDGLQYYNLRVLSTRLPWTSVGVTHEYYDCGTQHASERLETVIIDDIGNGGCKADKYERDIALLLQGVQDEPCNPRYMFYLANTYRDVGRLEEAVAWYRKRIDAGGWKDEIFDSYYNILVCQARVNRSTDQVLEAFIDCHYYDRERLEPVHHLLYYCRTHDKLRKLAYHFGLTAYNDGLHEKRPDTLLFVQASIYEWNFLDEFSIACFAAGDRETGKSAISRINLQDVPSPDKERIRGNLAYFP